MKYKVMIVILMISLMVLSSCNSNTAISIAETVKTYDELVSEYPNMHILDYGGYIFYADKNGDNIVSKLGDDYNTFVKTEAYPDVEPTKDDFSSIKAGMSVFEVVQKLGLPVGSHTFGLSTLTFEAADGTQFLIVWSADMTVIEINAIE